jgi:hypothetical protein
MKKIGMYATRGKVFDGEIQKINLFDGSFRTGYKLVEFYIAGSSPAASNSDSWATVATEQAALDATWDWADSREIAWAGAQVTTFGLGYGSHSVIDPENMIIEDLYVYGNTALAGTFVNYMMVFEKYQLDEFQGIVNMIQNGVGE